MMRNIQLWGAALGLALSATGACAATLPLKGGHYVLEGTTCRNAPFAVQFSYEAGAFSYPHATQCRSSVVSRRGRTYVVRETCAAQGDGTPAKADALTTHYRVLSSTRVTLAKRSGANRSAATYRWCPVEVN